MIPVIHVFFLSHHNTVYSPVLHAHLSLSFFLVLSLSFFFGLSRPTGSFEQEQAAAHLSPSIPELSCSVVVPGAWQGSPARHFHFPCVCEEIRRKKPRDCKTPHIPLCFQHLSVCLPCFIFFLFSPLRLFPSLIASEERGGQYIFKYRQSGRSK